jgi:hypothetical protein
MSTATPALEMDVSGELRSHGILRKVRRLGIWRDLMGNVLICCSSLRWIGVDPTVLEYARIGHETSETEFRYNGNVIMLFLIGRKRFQHNNRTLLY